eukprot:TRINITY_DN73122_c0_g1_i1.p1 TRINITY_DN73122_c0_g1~~TRINITY_DN73122_c0_g1_i1.p1  ORF type:complete len:881 (+),score=229.38 TRINITY_DN73122_c0_g1_i1:48-2645(+)
MAGGARGRPRGGTAARSAGRAAGRGSCKSGAATSNGAAGKSGIKASAIEHDASDLSMIATVAGRYALKAGCGRSREGTYRFDARTRQLFDETGRAVGTFSCAPLSRSGAALPRDQGGLAKMPCVEIVDSEVMAEIQKPSNEGAYFVLPSQLNGAEYPSNRHVVERLQDYTFDNTGGPRGQLAVHPAAGQFILDNAATEARPEGINAVDGVLHASSNFGFRLENGYLVVPTLAASDVPAARDAFRQQLQSLRPLVMEGVPACGLRPSKAQFSEAGHSVNLVYASAVPVQAYMNRGGAAHAPFQAEVASSVLVAQYYGALKSAAAAALQGGTRATVYLMPLGGGVFNNPWELIAGGMSSAVEMLSREERRCLDIRALTWQGNPRERSTLSALLEARGKLRIPGASPDDYCEEGEEAADTPADAPTGEAKAADEEPETTIAEAEQQADADADAGEGPAGLEAWEERFYREGFEIVAGTDEAGRGPLAGPVVAAAFAVLPGSRDDAEVRELVLSANDSKALTDQDRDALYERLTDAKFRGRVAYAIGEVPAAEIDRSNILRASLLAMARAVQELEAAPDCVLVDGCNRPPELLRAGQQWTRGSKAAEMAKADVKQRKLSSFFAAKPQQPSVSSTDGDAGPRLPRHVEAVVGGDARVPCISAASILAKVHRDRVMAELHAKYPMYGFDSHKGYGTAAHLEAIEAHGVCPEHRRSFAPIRAALGPEASGGSGEGSRSLLQAWAKPATTDASASGGAASPAAVEKEAAASSPASQRSVATPLPARGVAGPAGVKTPPKRKRSQVAVEAVAGGDAGEAEMRTASGDEAEAGARKVPRRRGRPSKAAAAPAMPEKVSVEGKAAAKAKARGKAKA